MINKSNSRLGFIGSLALHSALFGGVWAMFLQPKPAQLEEITSISLELIAARLEQPQVAVANEIDPLAEEIAQDKKIATEPEPEIKPESAAEPVALPKPEPKPKEKAKDPPKPKPERAKPEPKKAVKALEKGNENKQGVVAKAIPNTIQGTKSQAGAPNGATNGNNPSINQAGFANGNTAQAGQNRIANDNKYSAYRATLQRALQQRAMSSYPQREKMMRKMGTVVLKFTLSPTGQIQNVQVQKSSGNDNLDAAAVKAAQNTKPPTPPEGFPSSINVPVKFIVQ